MLAIVALTASVGAAAAAVPLNDEVAGATALKLGVPLEFDSTEATTSPTDPTDCDGSHGPFPGPYFASVWFSFTAKSAGQLNLSAPTMQGDPDQFLAISFVYEQTASGLTLDRLHSVRQRRVVAGEAGRDLPDHGGRAVLGRDRRHGILRSRWHGNDHDHPLGQCVALHLPRLLLIRGLRLPGRGRGRGRWLVPSTPGKHGDPTPYLFDNYEWHAISTNPANGKWFREDGNGLYRDLHITNVEGTVYTFVAQETGRPYSLTAMDGTKVLVDRGRLLTTFQVDTKGDDDLSNDEEVEGSWALLAENGSHPGFFLEDYCAVVQELIG